MKKLLIYTLLATIFIFNSGAGCGSQTVDPQPDNFQSLIGKWEAQGFQYDITLQNGSTKIDKVDLKARGVKIIWEFFKDGRLVATEGNKSREVRWKLQVTKTDGKDIEQGKLIIIGAEERELAQAIGQSGDLTHDIVTYAQPNSITGMQISIDATSMGPYKKNILTYTYHKL